MKREMLSKKTRYEFQEQMVGWTLREIEAEFTNADIYKEDNYVSNLSGQRRSLVDEYYHAIDFTDWYQVKRLLNVYEEVLNCYQRALQAGESWPDKRRFDTLVRLLEKDGFRYQNWRIIPNANSVSTAQAKNIAQELNLDYIQTELGRIESFVDSDPCLAIGSAKELIETCAKSILIQRGIEIDPNSEITKLTKAVMKELKLLPEDVPDSARGADTIKRLMSNLATVAQSISELRNLYGTGHGKDGRYRGPRPRHARLVVGASIALVTFLMETHIALPIKAKPDEVGSSKELNAMHASSD